MNNTHNDIRHHSVAEFRIANLLASNGITFIREFSLPDLAHASTLRPTEANGRQANLAVIGVLTAPTTWRSSFIGDRKRRTQCCSGSRQDAGRSR